MWVSKRQFLEQFATKEDLDQLKQEFNERIGKLETNMSWLKVISTATFIAVLASKFIK